MKRLIAIGGGTNGGDYSIHLEKKIVSYLAKKELRALFVPFAAMNEEKAYADFKKIYEDELNCKTDMIYSHKHKESEMIKKVESADLIYLGGGSTLQLMERLRQTGVDQLIHQAYINETPLAGFSAGANSLFKSSISSEKPLGFIRVPGLALLPFFLCAHFNYEDRSQAFESMIQESGETGLGLDDHAALLVEEDCCLALSASVDGHAYAVHLVDHEVVKTSLPQVGEFRPLKQLVKEN